MWIAKPKTIPDLGNIASTSVLGFHTPEVNVTKFAHQRKVVDGRPSPHSQEGTA